MCLAVPISDVGTDGHYSLSELKQIQSDGNEILMHGIDSSSNSAACSLSEFKQMIDNCVDYANQNNFNQKAFVYPQGLQPYSPDCDAKLAYARSKGIEMAFNVNNSAESTEKPGYEEWFSYANGRATGHGTFNVIPFVQMPNGYSKSLLLNRAEVDEGKNISISWWKKQIDEAIQNHLYICFFTHCYRNSWTTPDDKGKTITDYFKEMIAYIKETYPDEVLWTTVSGARAYINSIS